MRKSILMKFRLLSLLIFFIYNPIQGQIITNFAGNGSPGYSGDGGLAATAQITYPTSIAADYFGNVYIAE